MTWPDSANPTATPPTSAIQNTARVLLGSAMIFAGIGHLTFARQDFRAQVPASLPFGEDFVVLASGVVEIALGGALTWWPRSRAQLGWLLGGFFVAVFPGNVSQYLKRDGRLNLDTDRRRGVRLLFQPLLVLWALWSTGAWPRGR